MASTIQTPPVLYEDNHLLALNKPAGLATMGTPAGEETLLTLAKQYIGRKYAKPGNVYLGVVSRLDVPTTGVVLFARTSKAARRLNEQFRQRKVEKVYWSIVEGTLELPEGELCDFLGEDERHRRMRIVGRELTGAKQARLAYHCIRTIGSDSLVEVRPVTGRKHQIRLQFSHLGHPVLGDRKYGSSRRFPRGIALHARRLAVSHPVGGTVVELHAPVPSDWPDVLRDETIAD